MSINDPVELARTIHKVQEYDTRIFGTIREIGALEEKHHLPELRAELQETNSLKDSTEAALDERKRKQLKIDDELALLTQKIEKDESHMMSGSIMNPKELVALQADLVSLKAKRDDMETEDLEDMEEIDRLREELNANNARIVDVEKTLADAQALHDSELEKKQAEITDLEQERDALKELIDPGTIATYEKLLSTKNGLAVAEILNWRSCSGCRVDFSLVQVDRIQHEEGIFRCEYCDRMLVK